MINKMQERQNQVPCEIVVHGFADWKECLAGMVKIRPTPPDAVYRSHPDIPMVNWAALHGATDDVDAIEVPRLDHLRKVAEINQDSVEREVVCHFLNNGYELEELELQFADGAEGESWGQCVWYKRHPAYTQPIDSFFKSRIPSFFHAMLKTEHAGDQQFCLYSTQCGGGVLFHKTIVYRRVVFSQSMQQSQKAS